MRDVYSVPAGPKERLYQTIRKHLTLPEMWACSWIMKGGNEDMSEKLDLKAKLGLDVFKPARRTPYQDKTGHGKRSAAETRYPCLSGRPLQRE